MSLPIAIQEAAEKIFATGYTSLDPELESMDPSERLEFSRPSKVGIQRFDARDEVKLKEAMFDQPIALERERAVWEYADRYRTEGLSVLTEVAKRDTDPSLRWSTLWAIQKFGGIQSLGVIGESLKDEHPEVRSWAHLLLREINGVNEYEADTREAKFDERNPFDQTLPLLIAGYARVHLPHAGWIQATLSPKWFESIMGRVMACTREDTFETDLVIEKRISKYHADGSDHLEIFKFKGFSQQMSPAVYYHQYEAKARHTFYPSGKVEETSVAPLDDVIVNIQRGATTLRTTLPQEPSVRVVQSVRGRYMGPAYINLNRILSNGMFIGAGEVQLSNYHHPVAGPLTNTFLFGTFKGKLSDLDGDGYLDVNTEPCHGTIDGELDHDLDGAKDEDPYDPFRATR